MLKPALRNSSAACLGGLLVHYLAFYWAGSPLLTETISEWIMAHTPSAYAVPLLATLGPWAKPFAMTGALAVMGFVLLAAFPLGWWAGPAVAVGILGVAFHYHSGLGLASFALPAALICRWLQRDHSIAAPPARREFLTSAVMAGGVAAVAAESYLREKALARRAVAPVELYSFTPPGLHFHEGLARKAVTPVSEFYGMSKNTVDPSIDAETWRLRLTVAGKLLREVSYAELLALSRMRRYATLRCISNTLRSDLMGTAEWTGIRLDQLIARSDLPPGIVEAVVLGADGHGDSFSLDYAFSPEMLLALGMNGKSLSRVHGFPVRVVCPRYYGFKNVKWIREIAFVLQPYYGTWPRLGYTKEPLVHISSHIDRIVVSGDQLRAAGVSFAGVRGIECVQVRTPGGSWVQAALDPPLSPFAWTRWYAELPIGHARMLQARALDGQGHWQEEKEGPLFPDGVTGPTFRSLS